MVYWIAAGLVILAVLGLLWRARIARATCGECTHFPYHANAGKPHPCGAVRWSIGKSHDRACWHFKRGQP